MSGDNLLMRCLKIGEKMKKILLSAMISIVAFTLSTSAFAQSRDSNNQELVKKITDYIAVNGTFKPFNVSTPSEGFESSLVFFTSQAVYSVSIHKYINEDGRSSLSIGYYLTTADLLATRPGDVIARELIYGQPKINQEEHLTDLGMDGSVNIYQTFVKKRGSIFERFTREERDSSRGGVRQFLYQDGKVMGKYRWLKASARDKEDVEAGYKEHLEEIIKHLGIK